MSASLSQKVIQIIPLLHSQVYWAIDDGFARWQLVSDFFIAVAYFSIPVELIYFVHKSQVFPFKWILWQFGAFIVLCGLTHRESHFLKDLNYSDF